MSVYSVELEWCNEEIDDLPCGFVKKYPLLT